MAQRQHFPEASAAKRLTGIVDQWRDEILNFTGELISTPSETPPGDERKIAAVIFDRLEHLGLHGGTLVSQIPERPSVIFRLRGSGGGPRLLYIAHTDTKPVGDARSQWDTDPFRPTVRNGSV